MASAESIKIHTSLVYNPDAEEFAQNLSLAVSPQTGLIEDIHWRPSSDVPNLSPRDIDLRHLTVLPGLVDAHTHLFLHAEAETPLHNQMLHESHTERIIRATNHARAALLAGFTTYRDLGSEGLGDADVAFRNAINRGIIPGPRCFVATNPIASSSGYALRAENASQTRSLGHLADEADGPDGVRAAVRRRIGAGADIIKVYADEERRELRFPEPAWQGALPIQFPPQEEKPKNYLLFSTPELKALVDEAHAADCPVAVHACSAKAMSMAAEAGADTIEHGSLGDEAALIDMQKHSCIYVPTLSVMEVYVPEEPFKAEVMPLASRANDIGVALAVGADSGPAAHGQNAREIELMVEAGIPLVRVLKAATLGGWRACGGDRCGRRFGWWQRGVAADIIGVKGDPRDDISALRRVEFVMKDAKVWKQDGKAVGMV